MRAKALGLLKKLRLASNCYEMEQFTIERSKQRGIGCAAEPLRSLNHRIEHRREVAGRGVDDLQHLGACCLPAQRLITLGVALS